MIKPNNNIEKIYLCRKPVDFRKAINGLSMHVEEVLCLNPFASQLFVFTNKRRNKIKILVWDKTGFILWLKALDKAQFKWPLKAKKEMIIINGQQLNWLLDGIDIFAMKPHKTLHYSTAL